MALHVHAYHNVVKFVFRIQLGLRIGIRINRGLPGIGPVLP